ASIADANYSGSASATLTIAPGQGLITLGDLNQTYDGTAKGVTVTTTPPGLAVSLSYDGASIAPTNAGSYQVVATFQESSLSGSVTNTLVINKAVAGLQLTGLNQTYSGTGKTAIANTQPSGLAVNLSYDGQDQPPTNSGSYQVVATIQDNNHTGSTTNTLVINKAAANITFTNLSRVYDGTQKTVTATTQPSGLAAQVSYGALAGLPINAGSYPVSATVTDPNYSGSANATLVIAKASASVSLGNLSQAYDGLPKAPTVSTSPAGLATTLSYNGLTTPPTQVGSYTVVAKITDANYSGSVTATLKIRKAQAKLTLANLVQTYDGTAKQPVVDPTPEEVSFAVSYNGQSQPPTNAGTYEVVATVVDDNYSGAATNTLIIKKASAVINVESLTQVYDGTAKALRASTQPSGLNVQVTYDGSSTPPVNAGAYLANATIQDSNFSGSSTATLVINKAQATMRMQNLMQVYDGNPKSASVITEPADLPTIITYNGESQPPTTPGRYAVTAALSDPNYEGTANATLVIAKPITELLLSWEPTTTPVTVLGSSDLVHWTAVTNLAEPSSSVVLSKQSELRFFRATSESSTGTTAVPISITPQ
ncbi:MAG TPA: MBG domain-containing protein, partial [Clostridia bacterium]|nr:MBG domain-containing protein [Clostridia bacterium]